MDKGKVTESVIQFKNKILEIFPDAITFLFGSYAKGNPREDSDIDVAVILPKLSEDYLWEDVPKLWRIGAEIDPDIEPVMLERGENTPLYHEVMIHGIQI